MKHYLIHFRNGLFRVVDGLDVIFSADRLTVYSQVVNRVFMSDSDHNWRVAAFARNAIVGYEEVSREDAAKYRLFWAELQLERAGAAKTQAGEGNGDFVEKKAEIDDPS